MGVTVVSRKQVNVAEDAVIAEEILVLKIASCAPLAHLYYNLVFSPSESKGKLRGAVRYAAVAYILAVEV